MTNIVGGNAGKIPHFDIGPDGVATNGLSKAKSSDFLELISILSNSQEGIEQALENRQMPHKTALAVSSLDKGLSKPQTQKTDMSLSEMINIIGDLKSSKWITEEKNITGSTLSQLSGIVKSPTDPSETDITAQLNSLIGSIRLSLDKLQMGKDFLTIKNSQIDFKDDTQVFVSLFGEHSLSEKTKTTDYLRGFFQSDRLNHESVLENLEGEVVENSGGEVFHSFAGVKNLPVESGKDGALRLNLSELEKVISENTELVTVNNFYLNQKSMSNKTIEGEHHELDMLDLEIELSANELNAELSKLGHENLFRVRENFPLGAPADWHAVSIDIPNKNLAGLNVTISLKNAENFDIPRPDIIINFNGNEDVVHLSQQSNNLIKMERISSSLQSHARINPMISSIAVEQNEIAIDQTQIVRSFQNIQGNNPVMENARILSSEYLGSSDLPPVDKISLNEISSPSFAKFLKDRLQLAINSVSHKINFKQEIANFIKKSEAKLIINEIANKVVKRDLGLGNSRNSKKELFLSSADIIGYRQIISDNISKTGSQINKSIKNIVTTDAENNDLMFKSISEQAPIMQNAKLPNTLISNGESSVQSNTEQNITRLETTIDRNSNVQAQTFSQRISLLEAQFSSRLANALLNQAINSRENFDLILEPETFGKVRVNVSIDSSQIDVKLLAENSSTLSILRASESMLQTISEQNGLKLAEYNVELSNNAQNNEGSHGRKGGKDQNKNVNEGIEVVEETRDPFDENDDTHSLNLIA